ncbi:MAG: hypothetical protein EXQ90_06025 [Rhodospirillales bacterium]|nr:hypothetical protein [Rhodospirillales bacterium]
MTQTALRRLSIDARHILTGLVLAGIVIAPARAADPPHAVETFGVWETVIGAEAGKKVCYMGSVPDKSGGRYAARGKSATLVTHRPGDQAFDVVSVEAGYTYAKGANVEVVIGDQKFELFTDGGQAWAQDAKADKALVEAMRKGRSMIIKGTSSRGTSTEDTYSLSGFTAAYQAIGKSCDVKS